MATWGMGREHSQVKPGNISRQQRWSVGVGAHRPILTLTRTTCFLWHSSTVQVEEADIQLKSVGVWYRDK